MDHRADPVARAARAVVLAGVIVLAGSLAHASADGLLPGPASMLTLVVVVAACCGVLLGRAASAPRLVALTVAGQLAVHTVLSVLAGHQGQGHGAHPASGTASHHVHHAATGAPSGGPPAWAVHAVRDLLEHPAMALAHVAASVAVGLWLAVGERALWALVALGRCRAGRILHDALLGLRHALATVGDELRAVVVRPADTDPMPQLPLWSRGPARRGPPAVQATR